jgi:subtilisin-like proprotein convertase family protein
VDAAAAVAAAQQRRPGPDLQRRYESSPERRIPDRDPAGIRDVIRVPDPGRARDVRVTVAISHTWIGDLVVRLTAPDGTSALLHDRAGAQRRDLRVTYDAQAVPALATLRNRDVAGEWTLEVQDHAERDTGLLHRWVLELDSEAEPLAAEDAQSVRIPDNDAAGVTRMLRLPAGQAIRDIAVTVDITHPWIGDLRVRLTPPGGTPIPLHNQTGGDADNLVRTWRSADVPGLQALRGRDAGGEWQLQVADVARRDEGKLNRWRIEVAG